MEFENSMTYLQESSQVLHAMRAMRKLFSSENPKGSPSRQDTATRTDQLQRNDLAWLVGNLLPATDNLRRHKAYYSNNSDYFLNRRLKQRLIFTRVV